MSAQLFTGFANAMYRGLLLVLCIASTSVSAQDGKTILILDSSGSMWGRIDETPKISIAQDVVRDLLTKFPAEQELGLMLYGHRRKGDCADIELLVSPATGTRASIESAIANINPKGKTPLSAAVLAAAEELRIEENVATVILVSDGIETCDLNPCDVGTSLENAGIDFTAHVIGFDVSEAEDQAQLQCLAENTGGKFLTADNAQELAQALEQVSVATEFDLNIKAVEGDVRAAIEEGLVWTLTNTDTGDVLVGKEEIRTIQTSASAGNYTVDVLRVADGATTTLDFKVGLGTPLAHALKLPELLAEAGLSALESAEAGSTISVDWTGPSSAQHVIALAEIGSDVQSPVSYEPTTEGTPARIRLPGKPGSYELRFLDTRLRKSLASIPLEILPVEASVSGPVSALVGDTVSVEWTGPDYSGDYIKVSKADAHDNKYESYTYTSEGTPLDLVMPSQPGTYELIYVMDHQNTLLARQTIEVEAVSATLQAPDNAIAGETISVDWTGPNYTGDYIKISELDSGSNSYESYTYTREGTPLNLEMPSEPGTYEIVYVMGRRVTALAQKTIEINAVEASLDAPDIASVGQDLEVQWEGPGYKLDYITVAEKESAASKYISFTYVRDGSPLQLKMPARPGDYEIRYVMHKDTKVLATSDISIADTEVSLVTPETATVGGVVSVEWDGPGEELDYLTIARPDQKAGSYLSFTYTREGSPLELQLPSKPGIYEVRYILHAGPRILKTNEINILDTSATLELPPSAQVGQTVSVKFDGPGNPIDHLTVAKVGSKGQHYLSFQYLRSADGDTIDLVMPAEPGTYEIRYIMSRDRRILAAESIEVESSTATIQVSSTARIGETIDVDWQGPNNPGDYLALAEIQSKPNIYKQLHRTDSGKPVKFTMPSRPGDYEIRYLLKSMKAVLGSSRVRVTGVNASLSAPANAAVEQEIELIWEGPAFEQDFISIAKSGADKNQRISTWAIGEASPMTITMPKKPGTYDIRYHIRKDLTIVATTTIVVE